MKKLYLFLFTVLCVAFVSKADITYTFNFTVEDPENVTIKVCDYDDPTKVIQEFDVKEGLNSFEYVVTGYNYANLFVNTKEGRILKVHKSDGSVSYDVADNALKIYLSPWAYGPTDYTYTIKTFDEATFRSNTVKVSIDNPDGIRITLRGGSVINADKTEYEIPFNEIYEDQLTIQKANYEELIYKVTANGEEVNKDGFYYYIPLVDRSDADDIKYITDVVITQDFPEDLMYTVKLIFANGDSGCISSVTYGDETINDFAGEDGFKVRPGKLLTVTFNKDDYEIQYVQKNNDEPKQATYLSSTYDYIGSDYTITVTATKYEEFEATLVIDSPEQIKVTDYLTSTELQLVAGENVIKFKNRMYGNQYLIGARDGYEISRIYDATKDQEVTISTWGPTTTIYLEENSKFEISTAKIIRDKMMAFYVDDLSSLWGDVTFTRGGFSIIAKVGYTLVDFRDKDNLISYSGWGAPSETKYYRNCEPMTPASISYFSITDPVNNDVIKIFYNPENAIEHTVAFDMMPGTLDGYEVKQDILATVDPNMSVKAVGKTQFDIAPISGEGEGLIITVGGNTIEAKDGVYTFETEGDTSVMVTLATSGIENVISGENGTADVYNLQGIRVARQANAADVNALPAGIYIVNGQKVAVK